MNKKKYWHKNIIIKTLTKEIGSFKLILTLSFFVILFIWNKFMGKPFEWEWIDPISVPPYVRLFYSALVFISLGSFLCFIGLYRVLYKIFVGFLGDFKTYKEVKSFIWICLIALMYFKIIPWIIDVLNIIISVGYNLFKMIFYISPIVGIVLILAVFLTLILSKIKNKYDIRPY